MQLVRSRTIDPSSLLTQHETMDSILDAYEAFEQHQPGWLKVAVTTRVLQ